jgi:hypothetical protein
LEQTSLPHSIADALAPEATTVPLKILSLMLSKHKLYKEAASFDFGIYKYLRQPKRFQGNKRKTNK